MDRKEAIEVIKKNLPHNGFAKIREAVETLIPEIKESEDEKIRKDLIEFVKLYGDNYYGQIAKASAISWIEKQGEKETDNVEQKFSHGPECKEQDIKMLESIIECIDGTGLLDSDQINWLKSFKDKYKNHVKDEQYRIDKAHLDMIYEALDRLYKVRHGDEPILDTGSQTDVFLSMIEDIIKETK